MWITCGTTTCGSHVTLPHVDHMWFTCDIGSSNFTCESHVVFHMWFFRKGNQTYQLRNNNQKLYLPKPKTNFLKRSFPYRGAVSWNQILIEKLPIMEIPETSISSFKRLIDGLCMYLNWEVIPLNHTFM